MDVNSWREKAGQILNVLFSPHASFSISAFSDAVVSFVSSSLTVFLLLSQIVSSSKDACFVSAVETLQQIR